MSQGVNPYASPKAENPYAPRQPAAAAVEVPYRSGAGRARFTMIMLGICAVLDVLGAGSSLLELQLLTAAQAGGGIDPEAAVWNDARQGLLGVIQLAAIVTTGFAFSFWVYRAHQNLRPLRASEIKYSPGWAVGSFFVPILNLFRPCQIMLEIWRQSDPSGLPPTGERMPAMLVGWWWGLWLVAGALGRVSFRMSLAAEEISEFINAASVSIAESAVALPLALCALFMVRAIDRNQTARYAKVLAAPPPPPTSWSIDSPV
jgi:hypothetical protein